MRKLKFPEMYEEFTLNRKLNSLELDKVKEGSQPIHMDDKWVIYSEEPWLYFHRFLTGICIYKMHINCQKFDYEVDKVLVNGDPEQYELDKGNELSFLSDILDSFLKCKIR